MRALESASPASCKTPATFTDSIRPNNQPGKKTKNPEIKDIGEKLHVKNIFDLVDKEIKGKSETDYPAEQQIRKYKRHGSEFIEDTKFTYVHECIIIPIIMHCRV